MCETSDVAKGAAVPIPRPRWGRLNGIVLFGVVSLALADIYAAAPARLALDGLAAGVVLVGVASWIRANRVALDQQDWCECAADTLTVRVIPSRRPEPSRTVVPLAPDPVSDDTLEETLIRT